MCLVRIRPHPRTVPRPQAQRRTRAIPAAASAGAWRPLGGSLPCGDQVANSPSARPGARPLAGLHGASFTPFTSFTPFGRPVGENCHARTDGGFRHRIARARGHAASPPKFVRAFVPRIQRPEISQLNQWVTGGNGGGKGAGFKLSLRSGAGRCGPLRGRNWRLGDRALRPPFHLGLHDVVFRPSGICSAPESPDPPSPSHRPGCAPNP